MKQDLKNSSFSFKRIKQRRFKRRIRFLFLLGTTILVCLLISLIITAGKFSRVQHHLLEGELQQARQTLGRTGKGPLYARRRQTLRALCFLFGDQPEPAQKILATIRRPVPAIPHADFLDAFISGTEYRRAEIYLDSLDGGKKHYSLQRAALYSARMNPEASEESLRRIPPDTLTGLENKKREEIDTLNRQLQTRRIDYVFDRNQKPLAAFDLQQRQSVSYLPGFDFSTFTERINQRGLCYYSLTLDRDIQESVHRLFSNYHGAFILLDLFNTAVIAAYSKPPPPAAGNTVFNRMEEPGSVIKLMTLFAYLKEDRNSLFPYHCIHPLEVENRLFYDWNRHGKIQSPTEALARSCNLAFASMALAAGRETLFSTFEEFRLNAPPFQDVFISFGTGQFDPDTGDYQFIRQSVGLSPLASTVFYTGFFTAVIARNGTINAPFLIQNIKNIYKIPHYNHNPTLLPLIENRNLNFLKVREAMKAVVDHPRGTGRHARVDFVNTALKTGTTGSRDSGLDAVVVGFFPADNPKYALAFKLHHAGRAEYRGAQFFKAFIKSFYNR